MLAVLFDVAALDPGDDSRVTLRFCNADDARLTGLDDEVWWPGVARAPTLNREGWNGNFDGAIALAQAAIDIHLAALKKNDPAAPAYRWAGAPMNVYVGEAGEAWASFEHLFAGLVTDYELSDGVLKLTAKVDSEPFEAGLLETVYAGTGGAEGGEDLKDKVKPLCFGYALNVEPVRIDEVNNVFQVHGYGPIEDIVAVYERAADFVADGGGAYAGDFADYAALVAATIPEGDWGSCKAEGMFRLGAPPAGLITADVKGDNTGGWHRSTPAIIERACEIAGVDPSRIDAASLAAFGASVVAGTALTIAELHTNHYMTSPTKLIDFVQSIVQPCNAQAGLSWLGKLQVTRFGGIGTPALTLDAEGRQRPPVLDNAEMAVAPPFWRIEMQANRCWRVHSKDEIAFEEDAVPMPVEVWTRSPTQPATPTGDDIPAGWYAAPPGYLGEPFGPLWRSTATQTNGNTTGDGWTEPVLTDSRYKGWVLALTADNDKALAATDSIRMDSDFDPDVDDWPIYYITTPITGPCVLRCRVNGAGDRVGFGFTMGGIPGPFATMNSVQTGVWIAQNDGYVIDDPGPTPVTGVFPFSNYAIDGDFTDASDNAVLNTPLADCLYELVFNDEATAIYVNGELERTYPFNMLWEGTNERAAVFQLLSPDAEIYDIEWVRGTMGRELEFPIYDQNGPLRRLGDETGWEVNAPNLTGGFGAAYIYSKDFNGGGRVEMRANAPLGVDLSIVELGAGRVEFWADNTYEAQVNGSTVDSGSFADGDRFAIQYSGRRIRIWRNASRLTKKKVISGLSVQAYFEFAAGQRFWDVRLTPFDEEEFTVKGSVNDTTLLTPITDGSPTVTGGYIVVAETGDIFVSPNGEDDVVASASLIYTKTAGAAATFTPDTKIQVSTNGGGSWSDVTTTQTPTIAPGAVNGGPAQSISRTGTATVSSSSTRRYRLVTKNSVAGTYTVTLSGYLLAEWQG